MVYIRVFFKQSCGSYRYSQSPVGETRAYRVHAFSFNDERQTIVSYLFTLSYLEQFAFPRLSCKVNGFLHLPSQ